MTDSSDPVTRIEFSGSLCRSYSATGTLVAEFETVHSPAYNGQYAIPLTQDGSRLYLPTWERGLFCYDPRTGEVLWRRGPGRVRSVELVDRYLIAEMDGRGIYKRDAITGELVDEFKMSGIEVFYRVSQDQLFVGPKRNKYFVFTIPDLRVTHEIPASELNSNKCLSFSIRSADAFGSTLVVSGWVQHPNWDYSDLTKQDFSRAVFLGDYAVSHGTAA